MANFYNISLIPVILKRFKVNDIVISELSDKHLVSLIKEYSTENNVEFISILNENSKANFNEYTLNMLVDLNEYDAIFLDDDPNWYTTYTELNIIKQNNNDFPLVFICNNVFPHKYRDSYSNPEIIPDEFKHEFSKELSLDNNIKIRDGFYHAIEENTDKNGVSSAINDFLAENSSIGIMNIKFLNGIVILYPKNSISQIRLSALSEEIEDYSLNTDDLSDRIIENQILSNYILNYNISENELDVVDEVKHELDEKERIINDYEDKVKFHDEELSYKNSQITGVNSELSLKESQIKNFQSKLVNRENEIKDLNTKLKSVEEELSSLRYYLNQKIRVYKNKEEEFINQLATQGNLYNELESKDAKIKNYESELVSRKNEINDLNSKLKSVEGELSSLKSDFNQKIEDYKNKEKEVNPQFNLNNELESIECQLKSSEAELIHEKQKLKSIELQYINQLAKLDNKEYCISCYKEEIRNNHLEIQYLKKGSVTKKMLNPIAYLYLFFKSNPKEISLNYKLYKALKNSKCFDIGYYLNYNEDIQDSNWCKYFSPELHYVCKGFNEHRKFNKKYFNRRSKKELLNYILTCEE